MDLMLEVLRLAAAIVIAFLAGKLISRLHLPAILGWLIAGKQRNNPEHDRKQSARPGQNTAA